MRYYFVVYCNRQKDALQIKGHYYDEKDALNQLEKTAVEYIKKMEGEKQAEVCRKYNQTREEVMADTKFLHGMFLQKNSDGTCFHLYEKKIVETTWLGFTSQQPEISHLGDFMVTDYHLDDERYTCTCNQSRDRASYDSSITSLPRDLLDELKSRLKRGNFGLRQTA